MRNSKPASDVQVPCMSEEAKESFEAELCWCIKQLQKALQNAKLSAKQVQDHTKALNSLMSKSTSIVKKRQVMRLSFGDYRSKMAEDEKKFNKINQQVKLATKNPNVKSTFFRKSQQSAPGDSGETLNRNSDGSVTNSLEESNSFKFNFNIPS